jgi:hypothetical protein
MLHEAPFFISWEKIGAAETNSDPIPSCLLDIPNANPMSWVK